MGKKGKKSRNAYSMYVEEQAKTLGMSMQEAYCVCNQAWQNLSEQERKVYKDREASLKGRRKLPTKFVRDPCGSYDSYGVDLRVLSKREQDEEEFLITMHSWIESNLLKDQGICLSGKNVVDCNKVFCTGHINIHCKTAQGVIVPAEIALVKFNIGFGVIETYHNVLQLKPIPEGYNYATREHAKKTHNIPSEDTPNAATKWGQVGSEVTDFLGGEPVFVLDREAEDFKATVQELIADHDQDELRVYDISSLFSELQSHIASHCQSQSGFVTTRTAAETLLEEDPFLYQTLESCFFHHAVENVKHCSLSIAKRRVYTISDKSCEPLGISAIPSQHLPAKNIPESLKPNQVEQDQIKAKAVLHEYVNIFGCQTAKCGSMGGMSFCSPDADPREVMTQKMKENEAKVREEISTLQLDDNVSEYKDASEYGDKHMPPDDALTFDDVSSVVSATSSFRKSRIYPKF